jgi:hypothetical protein
VVWRGCDYTDWKNAVFWLCLWEGLLICVGVFLSVSRTGHPILPEAKVAFLPAGVLMLAHAALVVTDRAGAPVVADFGGRDWSRMSSGAHAFGYVMILVGVGLIGLGLSRLTGSPEWNAATVPAIVVCALLGLRRVLRGRDGMPWKTYGAGWMMIVISPFAVALALGVIPSDDDTRSREPGSTAYLPAGPREPSPSAIASLKVVKARLAKAGYRVTNEPPSRFAEAALLVDDVVIAQYADEKHVRADLDVYRQIFRRPTRAAFVLESKRLYMLYKPSAITANDRFAFRRLINVAEGR